MPGHGQTGGWNISAKTLRTRKAQRLSQQSQINPCCLWWTVTGATHPAAVCLAAEVYLLSVATGPAQTTHRPAKNLRGSRQFEAKSRLPLRSDSLALRLKYSVHLQRRHQETHEEVAITHHESELTLTRRNNAPRPVFDSLCVCAALGFETASSTDFVGPPVSPMASALSDLKVAHVAHSLPVEAFVFHVHAGPWPRSLHRHSDFVPGPGIRMCFLEICLVL